MDSQDSQQQQQDQQTAEPKQEKPAINDEISLSSRKRWFWISIIIAIINPIFAGLILGVFFLSEKELKKEGRIVLVISIVFASLYLYLWYNLLPWLVQQGIIQI